MKNQLLPRTFTASWDAASDVSSYTLRWKLDGANFQDDDQVSADAEATTADFTVSQDGEYEVELQGAGDDGSVTLAQTEMQVYSYRPGHLIFWYWPDCGPNRITGVAADPVDGGVEVRWSDPNDPAITKYQYHYQKGIAFHRRLVAWMDADGTDATTTTFTLTGLANGETHGLIFQAVAGSKTHCLDKFIWVTPSDPTIASPPTGFSAAPAPDLNQSVKLSWDDPDDSSLTYEYEYFSWNDNVAWEQPWTAIDATAITSEDGRQAATISGLRCPGEIQFRMRARRGDAIGPLSVHRHTVVGLFLTSGNNTYTIPAGENNCVFGGDGNDTLSGAEGGDRLYGGYGNDWLHGHGGDDTLYGIYGNDALHGGDGDDTLRGHAGNDALHGGDGDDTLRGGWHNDALRGGDGDDAFYFYEDFGNDTISDYSLGASQADSEKIYLCMGTGTNLATHAGADSGSDRVITVTFDGATAGTITLKGITSGSANFANLNVIAAAADSADCSS